MYGVFLILVLIITGGAIAFIGDHLGSKVGKKKLSVLGLRPKHTSMLVTIITGICITTLTLGVMTVSSENVRTALFGMEKLNRSMEQAKNDLVQASAELAQAKAEQDKAVQDLANTKEELLGLQEQKNKLAEENSALLATNQQLSATNQQLSATNQELSARSEKLTKLNNILEEGNERLKNNNAELEAINKDLSDGIRIIREGDIAFRAGETLAGGSIKGKQTERMVQEGLGKLIGAARYNVAQRLGEDVPEQAKDIWIYQPELQEAVEFMSTHNEDYVVRIVAAGNLIRGEAVRANLQLFKNKQVYGDNELIAEKELNFNPKNTQEVEKVISTFLQDINRAATNHGILPDYVSGSVGVIDGEQIYKIMEALQAGNGRAVISAFAEGATDVLGPLRIRLKLSELGILP